MLSVKALMLSVKTLMLSVETLMLSVGLPTFWCHQSCALSRMP